MKVRKIKKQTKRTLFEKKKKITLFESEMPQKTYNEEIKPRIDYIMKKYFGFNPTPEGYYVKDKFCMTKKVLNLFKKIGRTYIDGMVLYYKPLIDAKVNPMF